MSVSKTFIIIALGALFIGGSIVGYLYLKQQKEAKVNLPPAPSSSSLETQTLKDIGDDLREMETLEAEFNTSEIEALEADVDPNQFDLL